MTASHKSEGQSGDWQCANFKTAAASLTTAENLGNIQKEIATLQAQFALLGHTLRTSKLADDGRVTYTVSRWGQSRCFSHVHDLQAFLTQIGGVHV